MDSPSGDQSAPALFPGQIADHSLLRCIGRGGYGEVWLARNIMGTYRAIKIVRRQSFPDLKPFERELAGIQRFEPISRSHEGFVDVLQVGRSAGGEFFYYIMELADDERTGARIEPENYSPNTLTKELTRRNRWPLDACLRLGLSLSNALDYLHQQNLVHRDIKPSNIILVGGIPKLADIGLVADIAEARSYVGTVGYIPPEGPGTPEADIYGLGKVLYEMSTGKDRQDFPELPSDLGGEEMKQFLELNEIIVRACHHDRLSRYRSARDLHADLTVLENGKSVRRLRVLERRMVQLNRGAAVAGIAALLLVLVYVQINRERRRSAELRHRQVGAQVAYGTATMEAGNYLGALPSLVNALSLEAGTERENTHRLRIHALLAHCPKLSQLWFHDARVNCVEFSPDGQSVAAGRWDGQADIRAASDGRTLAAFKAHRGSIESIVFSADGRQLLTASRDGSAILWDVPTQRTLQQFIHGAEVNCARFTPGEKEVVTAGDDGKLKFWVRSSGQATREFLAHTQGIHSVTFSPDERWIATAAKDDTVAVWDAQSHRLKFPRLPHRSWVFQAGFSPDSQRLATAEQDQSAHIWELATGKELVPYLRHRDGVRSIQFDPRNQTVLSACWDSTVRIWNAVSGHPVFPNAILPHSHRVMNARFDSTGRRIVTACIDGTVRIWDLAGSAFPAVRRKNYYSDDGTRRIEVSDQGFQVVDAVTGARNEATVPTPRRLGRAAFTTNCRFLVGLLPPVNSNRDGPAQVQVWDLVTRRPHGPAVACANSLNALRLNEQGSALALVYSNALEILELPSGARRVLLPENAARISQLVWAPDGKTLISVKNDLAQAWDPATGHERFPQLAHPPHIAFVTYSPNGERLATCTQDNSLNEYAAHLWDAQTGQLLRRFPHRDGVLHAAFSSDSARLLTTGEDSMALIWDCQSGERLLPPLKHGWHVTDARFNADNRWILTASRDRMARLWDAATGEPLTPPLQHPSTLWHVKFVTGRQQVVLVGDFNTAWVWDLPSDQRPLADLKLLAQLLAGEDHAARGLKAAWQTLRTRYPDDFLPSPSEIQLWEAQQSGDFEDERIWSSDP